MLKAPTASVVIQCLWRSYNTSILQDALDLEDADYMLQQGLGQPPLSAAEELKRSMFLPPTPEADFGGRRGGRGRGRGGRFRGRGYGG